MTDLLEAATLGGIYGVTTELLPQQCATGPSRQALVGFYQALECVVQERLAIKELGARDQATLCIGADLERRGQR